VKVRCVLFGLEDTLYDASLQMNTVRLNAVKAMVEAGLPTDVETAYRVLQEIVKQHGPDYTRHFDRLLERLGLRWNPRVIAAGVVAYRETSPAYLKPFPDTIPTLLRLRDGGYTLGVVSEGRAVKQWQKLIQLSVQHLFSTVVVSEELDLEGMSPRLFEKALGDLGARAGEAVFVGSRLETDILCANEAGVTSVRIRKGESRVEEPRSAKMTPRYEIGSLSEIFQVLKRIEGPAEEVSGKGQS